MVSTGQRKGNSNKLSLEGQMMGGTMKLDGTIFSQAIVM